MKRKFRIRKQIRELKKNKRQNHQFLISSLVSIATLLGVLYFSYKNYQIYLDTYKASIEPQLTCEIIGFSNLLSFKLKQSPCLLLKNDGVNYLEDIQIKYQVRFFDTKHNRFGGILTMQNWKNFNGLEPKDSTIIPIDSEFVSQVLSLTKSQDSMEKYGVPKPYHNMAFLIYKISFRRFPDNKLYIINRFGYLVRNGNTEKGIIDPLNTPFGEEFDFLKPKLEEFAEKL